MTEDYPKIILGVPNRCGKTLMQIKDLVKWIESYDNTSVRHRYLVEQMDKSLQELSKGSIKTRIWRTEDVLHCVVIYKNHLIKEMIK